MMTRLFAIVLSVSNLPPERLCAILPKASAEKFRFLLYHMNAAREYSAAVSGSTALRGSGRRAAC